MKNLVNAILEIAEKNQEGFTVTIPALNYVTNGYVCAYSDTQNCFDAEGLKKVICHAESHENVVGGWLDKESNRYYFDSCKVFDDFDEAVRFGKEHKQIAIFDFENFEEIRL